MDFKTFIGVDVSKNTLDFAVYVDGKLAMHNHIENKPSAIRVFKKALVKQFSVSNNQQVYCMEHTGIYCNHLLNYLTKEKIAVWLENPLAIKAFFGLARGKNDQVDAIRIAEYAYSKRDRIKLWEPTREEIRQIKNLLATRDRFIRARKSLLNPVTEGNCFVDKDELALNKKVTAPVVAEIDLQLRKLEKQITNLIKKDKHLKRLNEVMNSVTGVGPIVSANVIVATNEFKNITDPRKMACHCGIAPFPIHIRNLY